MQEGGSCSNIVVKVAFPQMRRHFSTDLSEVNEWSCRMIMGVGVVRMLVQTLSSWRSAGNVGKEAFPLSFYSRGIERRELGHSLVGWWI